MTYSSVAIAYAIYHFPSTFLRRINSLYKEEWQFLISNVKQQVFD